MKKILICLLAGIAFTLEVNAQMQDTVNTVVNNLKFTTVDDGINKSKVVTYNGKTYSYTGSITTYKKQLKYFGDCRILIVGDNKIIIL